MVVAARVFVEDHVERRGADRRETNERGVLWKPKGTPIFAVVENISSTGCLLRMDALLPLKTVVHIGIPGNQIQEAQIVRQDGRQYGCKFLAPLSFDDLAVVEQSGSSLSTPCADAHGQGAMLLIAAVALGAILPWALLIWGAYRIVRLLYV